MSSNVWVNREGWMHPPGTQSHLEQQKKNGLERMGNQRGGGKNITYISRVVSPVEAFNALGDLIAYDA